MNRIFRNIAICSLAAAAVAAIVLGYLGSEEKRRELRCQRIEVSVLDSAVNKFLDGKEVVRIVDRDFGGYVNRYVDSVNLQKVENVLRKKVFIKNCTAYMDREGVLHVELSQYSPVMRIRHSDGKISYMDERGRCFPVLRDWAKKLKTLDGPIRKDDPAWMSGLAGLSLDLCSNRRLDKLVSRIHCTKDSEIHLELEGRREIFDIGTPTDNRTKLYRVEKYLDDIAPLGNEYSEVIVKYKKQIICKIWKENTSLQ